jgi:hypothetical protein
MKHSTTGKKGLYKIFIEEKPTYIAIVIPISNAEKNQHYPGLLSQFFNCQLTFILDPSLLQLLHQLEFQLIHQREVELLRRLVQELEFQLAVSLS